MAEADAPLWQVLREDIDAKGVSVRQLAMMLQEKHPRKTYEYWEADLRKKMLRPGSTYAPTRPTAELLAKLLGQPKDRYIRQRQRRQRIREERDALQQENQRLRDLLRQAGLPADAQPDDGSS